MSVLNFVLLKGKFHTSNFFNGDCSYFEVMKKSFWRDVGKYGEFWRKKKLYFWGFKVRVIERSLDVIVWDVQKSRFINDENVLMLSEYGPSN